MVSRLYEGERLIYQIISSITKFTPIFH